MKQFRKVLPAIGIGLLLLLVVAITVFTVWFHSKIETSDQLILTVEEVGEKTLTLKIRNNSDSEVDFSPGFELERRGLIGWYWISLYPKGEPAVLNWVPAGGEVEVSIPYRTVPGSGLPGRYRVVKWFKLDGREFYLTAEFQK